jgi:hypothetical protein
LEVSSWGCCSDLLLEGMEDALEAFGSAFEELGDMDMLVLMRTGMDGFKCG